MHTCGLWGQVMYYGKLFQNFLRVGQPPELHWNMPRACIILQVVLKLSEGMCNLITHTNRATNSFDPCFCQSISSANPCLFWLQQLTALISVFSDCLSLPNTSPSVPSHLSHSLSSPCPSSNLAPSASDRCHVQIDCEKVHQCKEKTPWTNPSFTYCTPLGLISLLQYYPHSWGSWTSHRPDTSMQ